MLKLTWKTITIRIPWLAKPCWCGEMNCARKSHQKPSRRSDASRRRQSEARKAAWGRKEQAEYVANAKDAVQAAWANAGGQMAKKDEGKNVDALAGIDVTTLV